MDDLFTDLQIRANSFAILYKISRQRGMPLLSSLLVFVHIYLFIYLFMQLNLVIGCITNKSEQMFGEFVEHIAAVLDQWDR